MSHDIQGTETTQEQICTVKFGDRAVRMAVENPNDQIQDQHRWGLFYEIDQLVEHRKLIFHHSTILDVGANVGNHSLFYATCTTARLIYPFEPNPDAYRLIKKSIALNDAQDKFDLSYLGQAVGETRGTIYMGGEVENNLGATFFTDHPQTDGAATMQCFPLDDLDIRGDVSFIKIDVEGMEIPVLKGAASLIAKHRPSIAIEVNDRNEVPFWQWVDEANYHVIDMIYESLHVRNYIMVARRSRAI